MDNSNTPDLRPPSRPWMVDQPRQVMRRHWYDSQASVFWTIVGALLTAGTISAIAGWMVVVMAANFTLREFNKAVAKPRPPIEQRLEQPQPARNVPTRAHPTWTTVRHPPKTVTACMQESGGVVNERYERCRAGWTEEVPVWNQ